MVDDGSSDRTAALARRTAGSRPDFRLTAAGELPPGWTGKAHACWRGAQGGESEWLCFIDADTLAAPPLLRSAVAYAEEHGIDMLSIEPEQILGTFWERVILPAGMFIIAFFASDLRAINDPHAAEAAANGQFILIRRRVYQAIGGHAAVRGEISEDTALARRVKQAGFHTLLAGSRDLIRVRMYTRLGEIWEGLSKNAVNMVSSRRTALLIALEGLLVGWLSLLLPAWAAANWITEPGTPALCGLLADCRRVAGPGRHPDGRRALLPHSHRLRAALPPGIHPDRRHRRQQRALLRGGTHTVERARLCAGRQGSEAGPGGEAAAGERDGT